MYTIHDIKRDVPIAATDLAKRRKDTAGDVTSEPSRKTVVASADTSLARAPESIFGFHPFPSEGRVVSNDLINKLRDSGDY